MGIRTMDSDSLVFVTWDMSLRVKKWSASKRSPHIHELADNFLTRKDMSKVTRTKESLFTN